MECLLCSTEKPPSFTLSFLFSFSSCPSFETCTACLKKLTLLEKEPVCPGCCRLQQERTLCPDCEQWQTRYPNRTITHSALYSYDRHLQDWIERFKFKGDVRLAGTFSKEMQAKLRPLVRQGYLLVPVPGSKEWFKKRGFEQVEEMLTAANLPYVNMLLKKGNGKKQSEKNRKERMETKQSFFLSPSYDPSGNRICLVDDVYTTGRTLFHAADVLLEAGAKEVRTFSVAR